MGSLSRARGRTATVLARGDVQWKPAALRGFLPMAAGAPAPSFGTEPRQGDHDAEGPRHLRQHARPHGQDRCADRRGARAGRRRRRAARRPRPGRASGAARLRRGLVHWVERHRTALATVSSAFFSVCLTAADDTDESREATHAYIDALVEKTGWTPASTATFAGALQYREYDFVTRLMMRLLMRHMHHETDASRDYDYTDWDAVDRWARELVPALAIPERVA
jgi:hypothetical protein